MKLFEHGSSLDIDRSSDEEARANRFAEAGFLNNDFTLIRWSYYIFVKILGLPKPHTKAMLKHIRRTTKRG